MSAAARRPEGVALMLAAHALLDVRREALVRRARRALLLRLLAAGTATADDVADSMGPTPEGVDRRFLGAAPGPLLAAKIIERGGYSMSSRAVRHASILTVWRLVNRTDALDWLDRHPELPDDPEPAESPAGPIPAATIYQPLLF